MWSFQPHKPPFTNCVSSFYATDTDGSVGIPLSELLHPPLVCSGKYTKFPYFFLHHHHPAFLRVKKNPTCDNWDTHWGVISCFCAQTIFRKLLHLKSLGLGRVRACLSNTILRGVRSLWFWKIIVASYGKEQQICE